MSNYNSLKTTIDANIKQNGRQEITGQILNSVLNQMVNTLGAGYQFAGVATTATNPGSPDAKVFYIANGKGTYTNFGGIDVTEDDVVVLYWDSSWHKVSTGIASQEKLTELEEEVVDLNKQINGGETEVTINLVEEDGWTPGRVFDNSIGTSTTYVYLHCPAKQGDILAYKLLCDSGGTHMVSYSVDGGRTRTEIVNGEGTNHHAEGTIEIPADCELYICIYANAVNSCYATLETYEIVEGVKEQIAELRNYVDGEIERIDAEMEKEPYFNYPIVSALEGASAAAIDCLESIIKKIEVSSFVADYIPGALRFCNLTCFGYSAGAQVRLATEIGIIANGAIAVSAQKQINLFAEPTTDTIAVDYGNGITITYDTASIWNYAWAVAPIFPIDRTINNPYRLYAFGEGNHLNGSLIEDESIGIDKFTSEVRNIFNGSFLSGKVLVSLCDSLGASSQWQNRLAEKTNAIYDKELNDGHYSIGGTKTFWANQNGSDAQSRAKAIVDDGTNPDVILIENVNDDSSVPQGNIEDESFFRGEQTIISASGLTSKAAADSYWASNFATIVNAITPSVGRIVGVPYSVNTGIRLKITGIPTANGNIGITLAGLSRKDIAVTRGEAISSIIGKILEYDWGDWIDIQDPYDPDSVIFTRESGTSTLTIAVNATGLTYTKTENVTGQLASWRCYKSHDVSHWTDSSYWVEKISKYAAWKGLVEYLFKQFPSAYVCWIIPQTYQFDYTSATYKRADGTIDYDKVLSTAMYQKTMFNNQVEFCKYYQLPYIDLREEGCLTPGNTETFMNVNNVHPKQAAYDRWADIIARLM